MKKIMIATLLLTSTFAVASEPIITYAGKQITPRDTRSTLIAKLGKPTNGDSSYSYWEKPNYSISASYGKTGLSEFGLSQMNNKPSTTSIKVRGKNITIGKDTLKTAENKLGKGCFDLVDTQFNQAYTFYIISGVKEDLYIKFDAEYVKKSKNASMNRPVFSIKWNYEHTFPSQGCNYG
ncbi:hypothetical protein [Acinetobacter guillouiae]|uniref:hypothetical protein n=1 Tax=Acinetobacter guillouiae TaxID=106649 RepID=UPI0026519ACB|nr:hypothetical protein [Chryseobacterium sp.]